MNIQVYPHRIILNKTNEVNSGEYNVNECTFEFSQEYEGLTKVAVFSLCDGTTKNVTILNNQCIIPVECLQETGQVQIGVYGYATQNNELVLRYSPTPQNFVVRLGSYKEGTQPVAPTPTDWEILVEQVSDIAEDVSSIHEDITGINGEISGINIDIRDLQDTKANINDLSAVAFSGSYNDLINKPNLSVYATKTDLSDEATLRENADVSLQEQIDAISVSSDVVDVVGTYQELVDYDTQHLKDNDIVKVLVDSTHNDALSYYRWDKEPQTWSYIGSEGPFYTKAETRELLNAKEDKITTTNKLDADLVDDSNSTNKFVTEEDITYWDNKEDKSNKVIEINSSSTDTQYPSAKCVYDSQEEQNEHIAELEMLYNAFPTVNDEDTTIQLDNTAKVKFREIDLKGNTSQVVIPEEQGTTVSNTSIYVSDVNTDKEHTIEMSGNTYQETTTGKNHLNPVPSDQATGGITTTANTNTGYITMVGTSDRNYPWILKAEANIPSGTTVVISSNSQYTMYARLYYDNSNYETINTSATNFITLSHDIIRIAILANMPTGTVVNETCYVQIETGSTATTFEKFTYGASPNPSYPQNIEVVTGTQNVEVCGKNLFNKDITNIVDNYYLNDSNELVSNNNFYIYPYTVVKPNTTYSLQPIKNYSACYCFYDINKNFISSKQIKQINPNFTTPANCQYLRMSVRKSDINELQLELGNQATTYSAYQGITYPVNLGNIELCKIGDYQDKIYKSNNKWYLEKQIGKVVLDGSENWFTQKNTSPYVFALNYDNYKRTQENICKCNLFLSVVNGGYGDLTDGQIRFRYNSGDNNKHLYICTTVVSILNDFTTWLSTHNTTVYYVLATPTTTEITDTNLVNQLNALYSATIYPITNINTDTSNLLPYIDLHYNFVTPSPSPSRPSVVNVVKGNNTITISNSDNTESQNYPINLGDMELCKIETYQDYIYESNGNWYKKNAIAKTTDTTGSTSITINEMVNNGGMYSYYGGTLSGKTITYDSALLHDNVIYYPLATPTDTQITDTTLITQLDNIKKAYSYDTQTNISQTNTDKPFIIYAEAIRSLKDVFE